jgi:hypothetical protein
MAGNGGTLRVSFDMLEVSGMLPSLMWAVETELLDEDEIYRVLADVMADSMKIEAIPNG